jgi:hypothetical protein
MMPLFVNILNKKLTKHTKSKCETKNSLKYTKTSSHFKNPHATLKHNQNYTEEHMHILSQQT